ncbi:MAG: hypothetical protein KF686_19405 [Ramlibacter sp.]|nr:hypothetical protein [Ramlibacter sp.]
MSLPLARLRRGVQMVWLHDHLSPPPRAPESPPPAASPHPPAAPASPASPASAASSAAAPPAAAPGAPAPAPLRMMGAPQAATPAHADSALFDVRRARPRRFWRTEEAEQYLRYWQHDASALREMRQALQRMEPSTWVFSYADDRVVQTLAERIVQGALIVTESALPPPPAGLPGVPAPPATSAPAPLAQTLVPIKPPQPPLLPILEEVQIEGAEVLPEILQSLEQIDLTLGELKLAPVSLAPTPSKIPEIETAMRDASSSVTATLDKL